MEGDYYIRAYMSIVFDFYPRPPGGGRPSIVIARLSFAAEISIHALRVEGDGMSDKKKCPFCISIHALRVEGDFRLPSDKKIMQISIHALRVEGDSGE